MELYSHLQPKDARKIISLANSGLSRYKINQKNISKEKILRCLEMTSQSSIKTSDKTQYSKTITNLVNDSTFEIKIKCLDFLNMHRMSKPHTVLLLIFVARFITLKF